MLEGSEPKTDLGVHLLTVRYPSLRVGPDLDPDLTRIRDA